jgi:YopX protein
MQQIKFRLWDQEKKVMCSVARISFGDDGSALTIIAEPAPAGEFYRGLVHGESGILMQFTGLKDKNGKEIYEGDIIEWRSKRLPSSPNRKRRGSPSTRRVIKWKSPSKAGVGFNIGISKSYEVIGNIYENPELLKA